MTAMNEPRVLGIVGWSGAGKTTLMERLIAALAGRGLVVSTLKHAHHGFDMDRPGKDSWRHRAAGAKEVLILSDHRWALLHEAGDDGEPRVEDLIARLEPADLVLIEGFKSHAFPKIEVHRPSVGKPPLWPELTGLVAVASDVDLADLPVPRLDLNASEAVADFVLDLFDFREGA